MNNNNNNSDKKSQNLLKKNIDLLNSLILSLKNNPLKNLQELSNELKVYSLILEIEPNFEKNPINNKIELSNDTNIDIRYNNFDLIFNAVANYKNESKSKDKFTKETNFTKTIIIKDLLNNDKDQLIKIAEMLCFLTIISSNKNYFIEKVNEIEDNQISNFYYSIIEKYIVFKIDESISSIVEKTNIFNNQKQNVKTYNLKNEIESKSVDLTLNNEEKNKRELPNIDEAPIVKVIKPTKTILISGYDNMFKEKEEEQNIRVIKAENFHQEKERILMQIKIDSLTKELLKMKENCQTLENDKKILKQNLNELKTFNSNINKNNDINKNEIKEEHKVINLNIHPNASSSRKIGLVENNLNNNNTNKELEIANELIKNLKEENEQLHKTMERIILEKQKLEIEVEKSDLNMQKLKLENDKIKEEQKKEEKNFNDIILKDKNIIEKLKNDLNSQIIINEKINEEKKIIEKEFEKYKIETNNNIINQNKDTNNNINNNINDKKNNNENELKNEIQKLKNNLAKKDEQIKELEEINLEYEKDKGEDINFYKKSYEEQKIRVNEEHKLISESLYKLAIHFMTLKDDLQKRINSANSEK